MLLKMSKDKKAKLLKIMRGRRITLPKEFCNRYNLEAGDYVAVSYSKDKSLRLVPGKLVLKFTLQEENGRKTTEEIEIVSDVDE